ncbi:MAG: zinc ABC transporter substrate-binding protein [Mediterranea sp.]|jgi:zinc transport system substrate-binding protein|nr:zinc ABC transporter substrate-binding protein [Mediterranea sp.]
MKTTITPSLILLAITLWACGGQTGKPTGRTITVTIEPQRYLAEAIAGERFNIVCMVPKGSSPETYDPTPRQLAALAASEAYFRIGHIGFETAWMEKLMENAPRTRIFDLSKGIELIHQEGHRHGDHYHAGGADPHIWNSAANAKIMANNIFRALCTLDKSNEAYYAARRDTLINRINETDRIIFQTLKHADHAFLIYHPTLSYFARDYGLHQICIEEDGKEPSSAQMKALIEISRYEEVRVIFLQPEFDRRNAEIIAKETGARLVSIDPLSYQWHEEMIRIARSLTTP